MRIKKKYYLKYLKPENRILVESGLEVVDPIAKEDLEKDLKQAREQYIKNKD